MRAGNIDEAVRTHRLREAQQNIKCELPRRSLPARGHFPVEIAQPHRAVPPFALCIARP